MRMNPIALLLTVFLLAGGTGAMAAATAAASVAGQDAAPTYRILITNDDGIDSPAIAALIKQLGDLGELVVAAPAENQSGSSHSITVYRSPVAVTTMEIAGASAAYAVAGKPADAVNFAVVHLGRDKPFDLVISGINDGANIGAAAHLSGTVGAAMEAGLLGVPAISVSINGRRFDHAAAVTSQFVRQYLARGTRSDVVYSINFPTTRAESITGIVIAPMGGFPWQYESYDSMDETAPNAMMRARLGRNRTEPEGTDVALFHQYNITITPLRVNLTHEEALEQLKEWDFQFDLSPVD